MDVFVAILKTDLLRRITGSISYMWIKLIPLVLGIIFLVVSMVIKYNVELRRSICRARIGDSVTIFK